MSQVTIETKLREEMLDITGLVNRKLAEMGASDGLCVVNCPHTTAGLVVNEGADPDVSRDILCALNKIVPSSGYRHSEGNSPAHVKSALVGISQTLPVKGGRLAMGRWQSLFFCEFDGPRTRNVQIAFIPSK